MNLPFIISASAGSGKTHTITEQIYDRIKSGKVQPDRIIVTTFTIKAANELKNRIRGKLINAGLRKEANHLNGALIGTINSICLELVKRFSLDEGISPELETLDEEDKKLISRNLLGTIPGESFFKLAYRCYQSEENGYRRDASPWISHVEKIIDLIRINDINKDDIQRFIQHSQDSFWKDLPPVQLNINDISHQFVASLDNVINNIDYASLSKTNRGIYIKMKVFTRNLRENDFTWHEWIGLKKIKLPAKALDPITKEEIQSFARLFIQIKEFREDWNKYVSSCFQFALQTLDTYETYKAERGFLDFVDQETKLYHMLKSNPLVQDTIRKEFDLVIVDEFQDTSPLQLAIFLKFCELVKENVWVGDPKQSIYAFRGTDPELMMSVLEKLKDSHKDHLDRSFRSRKPLTRFCNAVFAEAFQNTLTTREIALNMAEQSITGRSQEEENGMGDSLQLWHFKNIKKVFNNQEKISLGIASQIKEFIKHENLVFDKASKTYRPAQYGDIAILCRTNISLQAVGKGLTELGIPVVAGGFGLSETEEVQLMLAIVKYCLYPWDSLAKTCILLFTEFDGDQSAMIQSKVECKDGADWGKENQIIKACQQKSKELKGLPVSTMLEQLIIWLDVNRICTAWGNINQRIANLDALILQAVEYESSCKRLKMASTPQGFLNWMDKLASRKEDKKGFQQGNAVQVLTWHGSKGLEWPVVVLWGMDDKPKNRLFSVNTLPPQQLDLQNPLTNRSIHFWFKPYMNGMTEVPVFDSGALESEISHKLLEDSLEEEKRLYYVAFTRARDYLILCTKTKKWPAPEAVNPSLKGLLQYSDGVHQTHFCWDDQPTSILVKTITKHQSVIDAQSDQKQRKIYFPRALGEKTYEPLRKRPSEVQTSPGSITGEIRLIHSAMEIDRTGVRDTDLGDAIHNAFCACSNQLTDRDNLDMIENSLDAFGLGEKLSPEELLNAYQSFFGKFVQPLNPIKVYKELPIQAMMNNQLMSGYIDLVLELENELILVDYKSFSLKEWKKTAFRKKALGFAGQLGMYAEVLEKTMSKKVSEKWIYFVGMGRMVEVC